MEMTKEQIDASMTTLTEMTKLLGFAVEITAAEDEHGCTLNVKTDDPGRLIGRKGHYLQSLETILNRTLRKSFDQCPWVEIAVNGYQKKKRSNRGKSKPDVDAERLEKMALDAAKEVKRWGEPQSIGPFTAAERRVIHLKVKEDDSLVAESGPEDRQGKKKITISTAAPGRQPES